MGDYTEPLAELRHHWGSAYLIEHPEPDVWLAQRKDNRETLRAELPGELLGLIRDDYAARPVSRHQRGGGGQPPAHFRFTVEG